MDVVKISKDQYRDHLKKLGHQDRKLRFLSCLTNDAIDRYVEGIAETDSLFGLIDNYQVIAAIHVNWSTESEFGVSVLEQYRVQGYGSLLVSYLFSQCGERKIQRINCVCARENRWMIAIAKKYNMKLTFEYCDCYAVKEYESNSG